MTFNMLAGVPVVGVTGINGAGKTALAVETAIIDMLSGREVYSTVPIRYVHPGTGRVYESKPVLSLRQLLELYDVTVLLDDVSVIFSNRTTQSLPPDVVTWLQTARHSKVTIIWTAPEWMRADNQLRGITQALMNVIPMFRVTDRGDPWPRPRLIAAGLLDTSVGKADATPTRVLRRRFYLPQRLMAWGSYDTHAATPVLGGHVRGGVCVDCGGSQERPKHNAARHELLGIPFYPDDAIVNAGRSHSAGVEFVDDRGVVAGTNDADVGDPA